MRPIVATVGALLWFLVSVSACRTFRTAMAPAEPLTRETPAIGEVPDAILLDAIRRSELIVLAVPLQLDAATGSLSPGFQLGAKETWYNVKLAVDSVLKGKLGRAKSPDLGFLPATYAPPPPFGRLARNEIVIQYPAVTYIRSEWAAAPPPVVGERAVFLFRRCWNCVTIALATGHGPYKASPLVAAGWGSKLAPAEWPRVSSLLASLERSRN
jgi:hypothetical protein